MRRLSFIILITVVLVTSANCQIPFDNPDELLSSIAEHSETSIMVNAENGKYQGNYPP